MTITVGTNSYITVANANTYFASSLSNDDWSALDDDTKERALITATRMIDRQIWSGAKTSDAQALQWPRTGVIDSYGNDVSSGSVPQAIIDATCELALAIYQDPTIQTTKSTSTNTKRVKAGSAEVEFFRPQKIGRFPTLVQELIGQFLGGANALPTPYASGTDYSSKIDPSVCGNDYNVNEGFS